MRRVDNSYYRLKMDAAAWPGVLAINKATAESRALTQTEHAAVWCAQHDRDTVWREWIAACRKNGQPVSRWDEKYLSGALDRRGSSLRVETGRGMPRLYLYGTIGDGNGITAEEFKSELNLVPDDSALELHVHSGGGDLWESIAIHNLLSQRFGPTHGFNDGLAASGASIVLMACDKIIMNKGSWMMVHGVQVTVNGSRNAEELQQAADQMKRHNAQLFDIYKPRWKGTSQQLRDALADELWMDDKQAVEWGLADRVSEEVAIAAEIDSKKFKYKNTPCSLNLSASAHSDRIHLRRRLMDLEIHKAACI